MSNFLAVRGADPPKTSRALDVLPLVGAAAGYFLWPSHRVLGVLGGATVGKNAADVVRGESIQDAARDIGAC